MTIFRTLAATASLALMVGCGAASHTASGEAAAPPAFSDLNDLLHAVGHTPTRLADLDKHKGRFSVGYSAVKSGEIVVLWGTPLSGEGEIAQGGGQEVVAYEKD